MSPSARRRARSRGFTTSRQRREMRGRMTFVSPKTGEPVLRAYQIPRSHADLRARRLFSETWAEATFGLMGRTPDHVAGFFCGYAATPSVFAAGGQHFAENVVAFYEHHARQSPLRVSYAIVPPQIDRSKPAHQQSDPTLYAGVVKEREDGIVISGAQQLATGGAISDCHPFELHPSAAARRRELRQLPGGPGQRAGGQALSAAAVRAGSRRTPSTIRSRAVSTKATATSCSTTCSCPGSGSSSIATSTHRATSGGRRRRIFTATTRRRCVTSPSCAS